MRLVFRTDASLDIGTGHVMRCLTLAQALHAEGADCHFVCRALPGNLIALIGDLGFDVTPLPSTESLGEPGTPTGDSLPAHAAWLGSNWQADADATAAVLRSLRPDWLVVDHYALNQAWEREVRPLCTRLMVIDDLADRPHDCDLLFDQNLGRGVSDYAALVPKDCKLLIGTRYVLLRPEFVALRDYSLRRRSLPRLRQLFISMGGVDSKNATQQILVELSQCDLPQDLRIIVVMGMHAPWVDNVRAQAANLPWPCEVRVSVNNMAQLMADSDLAVGAAGSTSWERCVLGLPSLILVVAKNQYEAADNLQKSGAATLISLTDSKKDVKAALSLLSTPYLQAQSQKAASLVDGVGVLRVIQALQGE